MALALYRTYRPGTLADVVGQEHVTEALGRALDADRTHHAYLFSGPRGCGKTSTARILARSLNCERGPTSTPCGTCRSCVDLAPNGPGSIDVIELDAATHRGIDDARDLREKAIYAPAASRYRVYIIDEAHQLTNEAANALLKLIEEPPAHLRFIFATTEPDKIIATIRSRTFHYPFRLVPARVLTDHLARVCQAEGVPAEPAALAAVARAGAGSVRDSLSVLGQLLAGAGPEGLTHADAAAALGLTDDALIDGFVDALSTGSVAAMLQVVERVISAGHDPRRFVADVLDRLRDLIILRADPGALDSGVIDVPDDAGQRLLAQTKTLGLAELSHAADLVSAGLSEVRGATAPRLQLELLCARLALHLPTDDLTAVLARLERLERSVAAGAPPAAVPGAESRAPAGGRALQQDVASAAREAAAEMGSDQSAGVGPDEGADAAQTSVRSGSHGPQPPATQGTTATTGSAPPRRPTLRSDRRTAGDASASGSGVPGSAVRPAPSGEEASGGLPDPSSAEGGAASLTAPLPDPSAAAGVDPASGRSGTGRAGTQANSAESHAATARGGAAGGLPGAPASGAVGDEEPARAGRPAEGTSPPSSAAARSTAAAVGPGTGPASAEPPDSSAASAVVTATAPSPQLVRVVSAWPTVLDRVAQSSRVAWTAFAEARPLSVSEGTLAVAVPDPGKVAAITQRGHDVRLREALLAVLELDLTIDVVYDTGGAPAAAPTAHSGSGRGSARSAKPAPSGPPRGADGRSVAGPAAERSGVTTRAASAAPTTSAQTVQGADGAATSDSARAPAGKAAAGARWARQAVTDPPQDEPDVPSDDDPDVDEIDGLALVTRELGARTISEIDHT